MFFNHVFVVRELVIWFWKFSKITKQSFISKSKPWKLCWNEQEPKSLLRKSMKRLVLPFVKSKKGGIFEGKHHVVSEVVGYSILEVVDNQSPLKFSMSTCEILAALKTDIQKINYFIPSPIHPNYILLRIHISFGGWIRIPKRSFRLTSLDTSPGAQVHCTGALTLQAWWVRSAWKRWRHDDYKVVNKKKLLGCPDLGGLVTCWWFERIMGVGLETSWYQFYIFYMHDNMMVSSIKTASQAIGISNTWQ